MENIKQFIIKEFSGWSKFEKFLVPVILIVVTLLSVSVNDTKVATVHAFFGILATILAGKGKISCYILGTVGVLCYAYLSFKNAFWGTFVLQTFYYLPMELIGIWAWKDHLKKENNEVKKTKLTNKQRLLTGIGATVVSVILGFILMYFNDKLPFHDAFVTVLPIIAFYLTVKRCIEQWVVWTIVNGINIIMWIVVFAQGGKTLATLLTWTIYFCFGLYFLYQWYKELKTENET